MIEQSEDMRKSIKHTYSLYPANTNLQFLENLNFRLNEIPKKLLQLEK